MSMIGKILGTFECTALLGKGGMGEVYKAKDQKLGRDVAIKVLPEEFAKDVDRVARFQREAKLLASLNHPNIAAIHGLEESDGTHFLVLELIEGDTLADRLKRGAIPVEESLKLALQIAEALEAAHEKGVIHRDLKPANIKVTPDGKAKVLDFGLAKAFAGEQGDMNLSNSPTLSAAATQQGVILGTAAYMSPEQASGEATDRRADIWAFGVVLYEMLTGRSLFEGNNVSQTLARVLERQPDFSALPPNLSPRIRLLLERCLEKEAKNRYGSISDARVDVEKVLADPKGVLVQPVTAWESGKKMRTILPWAAASLILGFIIAGAAVWMLRPAEPKQVVRFCHELQTNQKFGALGYPVLAVSPDGNQFVYSTNEGLYLRSLNGLDAKAIVETSGSLSYPSFSPNGQWIVYYSPADTQLKKISIEGGAATTICNTGMVYGVSWEMDDIIFYSELGTGVLRVSANGGKPEVVISSENEPIYNPQLLPDGKSVIFTTGAAEGYQIVAQSLESGERKEMFAGECAVYLSTGHLAYILKNDLFAIPFNPNTLEVTGGQVPLVEGILQTSGPPQFAISEAGTLVFLPETMNIASSRRTLVWVDREGNEEQLTAPPNAYAHPKISPNGKYVALMIESGGNTDIQVWDLDREAPLRLTKNDLMDVTPLWTTDGQRILFSSNRNGNFDLFWRAADGSGEVMHFFDAKTRWIFPSSWSIDGKTLICTSGNESNYDISALSMEGDPELKPLLNEQYDEGRGKISPDGKWMAYVSNDEGQPEIYVRPYPEADKDRIKVSINGGVDHLWSPNGDELFYRNGDAVITVDIKMEPEFKPGKPKILFRGSYALLGNYSAWDIHPNKRRFLMLKETTGDATTEKTQWPKINIVLNWFEELKERVPQD